MENVRRLTDVSCAGMREVFLKNTSMLVFRRVGRVVANPHDLAWTIVETPRATEAYYDASARPKFTLKERLQNVEENYSTFYFMTTKNVLRDTDHWDQVEI